MDYNCDKVWIPIVNGTLISINFTHILKIKHIIWMIKYPCMHENGQVFCVNAKVPFLVFVIQIGNVT